jgi:hypothetical protein
MNNEQQQAMDEMVEWRDAIHKALKDGVVTAQDGAIWWSLIGIRSAMTKVTDSFGMAGLPQDLDDKVTVG